MVSKCAEFRQECRDNFFFRFWTRFDPLLAILLVQGGRAYIGQPGQKDLEENPKKMVFPELRGNSASLKKN